MSEITIYGLSELNDKLNALSEELEKRTLKKAVRKGAQLFRRAMVAGIHRTAGKAEHASSGSPRKHLADDLRIHVKGNAFGASATVGPSSKTAYIGNFLEFGTAPHLIEAHKGKELFVPGVGFTKRIRHPGSPAKPFMRPAFDTQVNAVIEAVKNALMKSIEKMTQGGK